MQTIFKKLTAIFLTIALVMALTACQDSSEVSDEVKPTIIATTFPLYDWTMNILGENAENFEVVYLLDQGFDLHSYEPTTQEMAQILDSDLFIYNGGESDYWVNDIMARDDAPNSLNMMMYLEDEAKVEEIVEGMQEHSHEHTHEEDEHTHEEDEHTHEEDEHTHEEDEHAHEEDEHTHEGEEIIDEHMWLSIKNAILSVEIILNELVSLDSENEEVYKANAQSYQAELQSIDEQYENMVENAYRDTVLVADRFPFRYLFDDYGMEYYAAFVGCSTDTAASFETIKFLADTSDDLALNYVLMIEGTTHEVAQTVVENSADDTKEILILNSMQSVTKAQIEEENASYTSIALENFDVLAKALEQ